MSLSSPSTTPDILDDVDLIWGQTDNTSTQEWSKLDEDFTNAGYREGITAGKEAALQEGFDDGFAQVGAPLGREIGVLRGVANAIMSYLSSSTFDAEGHSEAGHGTLERRRGEIQSIIGGLGWIHLEDLAPRDLQAEEHAKEHLELGNSEDVLLSFEKDRDANGIDQSQSVEYRLKPLDEEQPASRPAVEELNRLRARLSDVLRGVGVDISLA